MTTAALLPGTDLNGLTLADIESILSRLASIECDEGACRSARSAEHFCECRCAGLGHGWNHREARFRHMIAVKRRIARTGGLAAYAGQARDDDEDLAIPVQRRSANVFLAEDEMPF